MNLTNLRKENEVLDIFCELAQIPSPSLKEEKVAEWILEFCNKNNINVRKDDYGNIYISVSATDETKESIMVSAHMDVVGDDNPIELQFDGQFIKDEFEENEQNVIAGIYRSVQPDLIDLESDLALIAVVGRGMRFTRGTSGRIFSALAHANVNVRMIDQGSSELNIIIGVRNHDFEAAIKAIYDIFVTTQI